MQTREFERLPLGARIRNRRTGVVGIKTHEEYQASLAGRELPYHIIVRWEDGMVANSDCDVDALADSTTVAA